MVWHGVRVPRSDIPCGGYRTGACYFLFVLFGLGVCLPRLCWLLGVVVVVGVVVVCNAACVALCLSSPCRSVVAVLVHFVASQLVSGSHLISSHQVTIMDADPLPLRPRRRTKQMESRKDGGLPQASQEHHSIRLLNGAWPARNAPIQDINQDADQ